MRRKIHWLQLIGSFSLAPDLSLWLNPTLSRQVACGMPRKRSYLPSCRMKPKTSTENPTRTHIASTLVSGRLKFIRTLGDSPSQSRVPKIGALGGVWAAGRGRFSSPSTLPWWGPICSAVSSAGLPSSRKMRNYWREFSGGLWGWWGDWSISPTRRGWGSWACSAWRREGWEGT